ncbi:MAG: acylphosphatase [gamma proteobacterium endosymbiont of Lamellibrachia anaximandri]|nr:acylphosphatase [gamma proteobacterium endosymbiont of Lamellibrachia anaximandri]MBL3617077.1 acylphosphatase [gamma proteobacterium endosymbiont of Lamellibrachia anaximandri]
MGKAVQTAHPVCVRCLVAGRVQGVFFRASTRYEAQRRGITGYAKNLHDGRVEVIACGDPEAVKELRDWLRQGPANADVSGIACENLHFQEYSHFSIT